MTKSLVFSWLSILSGRQRSSFSAQHPRLNIPKRFFFSSQSQIKISLKKHIGRCQILTLSERDIYWHDKTMEYLVPICLVLGNLIDPQGESHLRIPQSQVSWKALCQLYSGKQWDTGQLLGRKNSIDKMLNHLEVFGQRDLIIRNKVDKGFESRNVKLIWLF